MKTNECERSDEVFEAVCSYLDSTTYCKENKEKRTAEFLIGGKTAAYAARAEVLSHCQELMLSVKVLSGIPQERASTVALAIAGVNNILADGWFVADFVEGFIVFRITHCFLEYLPDKKVFDYMVGIVRTTANNYYEKFKRLANGGMSLPEFIGAITML